MGGHGRTSTSVLSTIGDIDVVTTKFDNAVPVSRPLAEVLTKMMSRTIGYGNAALVCDRRLVDPSLLATIGSGTVRAVSAWIHAMTLPRPAGLRVANDSVSLDRFTVAQ